MWPDRFVARRESADPTISEFVTIHLGDFGVDLQCSLFAFHLGAFTLSLYLESILYKNSQNYFSMFPLTAHLELFCMVMPTKNFKTQAATISENHPSWVINQ